MIHALLIIAALAATPRDIVIRESVDLVELSHFYDERGSLVFDQVIFYEWNERAARYDVMAWRLVKHESQLPRPDCCGRKAWTVLWNDSGTERAVTAWAYRETWEQYDVELEARSQLPVAERRKLKGER